MNSSLREIEFLPFVFFFFLRNKINYLHNNHTSFDQHPQKGDFNFDLKNSDGLDILPPGLKVKEMISYLLTLKKGSDPLYRTKLMVVGNEMAGKTSLIHKMFPIKQFATVSISNTAKPEFRNMSFSSLKEMLSGDLLAKDTTVELSGEELIVPQLPHPINLVGLTVKEKNNDSLAILQQSKPILNLIIPHPDERASFSRKITMIAQDARTHGIDIHHHEKEIEEGKKLELSIWDFGGQERFYNNHHYFLSARSIFLVVWNVAKGLAGIEELRFWLKSLKTHLPPLSSREKPLYSIVVVGTHIDSVSAPENTKKLNEKDIRKVFVEVGHPDEAFNYREVSSKTGEGIEDLLSLIDKLALSHPYMGEMIPKSFLKAQKLALELRKQNQKFPAIPIKEFLRELQKQYSISAEDGRKAIRFLHAWGTCMHFESSSSSLLSKYLVLDPSFLTKEIISKPFNVSLANFIQNGKLKNERLKSIWQEIDHHAEFLAELLECFGVCFQIREQEKGNDGLLKTFWERESIIPAFLPEHPPKEFSRIWKEERPKDENQIKRNYQFNTLPTELINRLHVQINHLMDSSMIWRGGFFLESKGGKVLIRANLEEKEMVVIVRGAYLEMAMSIIQDIDREIFAVSANYASVNIEDFETEVTSQKSSLPWWNISAEGFEKQIDGSETEARYLHLYKSDRPEFTNEVLGKKLEYSLWHLGTSLADVEEAYAIINQESQTMFNAFLVNLDKKFMLKPQLFKQESWKNLDHPQRRKDLMTSFEKLTHHPWNTHNKVWLRVFFPFYSFLPLLR